MQPRDGSRILPRDDKFRSNAKTISETRFNRDQRIHVSAAAAICTCPEIARRRSSTATRATRRAISRTCAPGEINSRQLRRIIRLRTDHFFPGVVQRRWSMQKGRNLALKKLHEAMMFYTIEADTLNVSEISSDEWLADSDASRHICNDSFVCYGMLGNWKFWTKVL